MVLVLTMCGKKEPKPDKNPELPTTAATQQTEPLPTEPEVVAKATVISQGDLLMHSYLFTSNPKYPAAAYLGEENVPIRFSAISSPMSALRTMALPTWKPLLAAAESLIP